MGYEADIFQRWITRDTKSGKFDIYISLAFSVCDITSRIFYAMSRHVVWTCPAQKDTKSVEIPITFLLHVHVCVWVAAAARLQRWRSKRSSRQRARSKRSRGKLEFGKMLIIPITITCTFGSPRMVYLFAIDSGILNTVCILYAYSTVRFLSRVKQKICIFETPIVVSEIFRWLCIDTIAVETA